MTETVFLIYTCVVILALCVGYIFGVLQGGIKIYKNQEANDKKEQEYNSSYLEEVPAEMRQYVEQNQGQYK